MFSIIDASYCVIGFFLGSNFANPLGINTITSVLQALHRMEVSLSVSVLFSRENIGVLVCYG
jgi:hypothetical protein